MTQTEIAELRKEYLAAVAADKAAWSHRAGDARTRTQKQLDLWREASEARDRYVLARLDGLKEDLCSLVEQLNEWSRAGKP